MKIRRWISGVIVICLSAMSVYVPAANAALIGTRDAVAALQHQQTMRAARAHLVALLERKDVAAQLENYGVNATDAQQRVAAMSDQEVQQLNTRMDQLPAGGDDILGVALVVFLVLLITDIAGYTDIFPFVNHGSGRR